MNVMKEAHRMTREFFKNVPSSKMSYAAILKENLKQAHKEYKAMQKPVENTIKVNEIASVLAADIDSDWYSVVGTCTNVEGETVYVRFGCASEKASQSEAAYYFDSKNGYTNIDLTVIVYGIEKANKEYKVIA